MPILSKTKLTFKQRLYLTLTLIVVYFPIILYVNFPIREMPKVFPFMLLPMLLTAFFYYLLVVFIEYALDFYVRVLGDRFLLDFKLPSQLLAVPIAVVGTICS